MDILYVPFAGDVDILDMAIQWAQNQPNKSHLIVQYQADNAPIVERHNAKTEKKVIDDAYDTIYVLAHGLDSRERNGVAANTKDQTEHRISMKALAGRFNHDLSLLSHRINKIKLYFCNNIGSEEQLAFEFQKHLNLTEEYRIDIYSGDLHLPSQQETYKTCTHQGRQYPVKEGRRSAFFNTSNVDTEINIPVILQNASSGL